MEHFHEDNVQYKSYTPEPHVIAWYTQALLFIMAMILSVVYYVYIAVKKVIKWVKN